MVSGGWAGSLLWNSEKQLPLPRGWEVEIAGEGVFLSILGGDVPCLRVWGMR
jgi:hypothetical protein